VIIVALVCFCGLVVLDHWLPFSYSRARNLLRDAIARAGRTTPPNPQLVFLAIDAASASIDETDIEGLYGFSADDQSTEARALRLMSHQWPWRREVHALVLDRLVAAGAKVVLFDLNFPNPTAADERFRLALDEHAARVVIGSNFVEGNHTRPTDTLVPHTTPMDDRVAFVNFFTDDDEAIRRVRFRVTFEQLRGLPPEPGAEEFVSLGARALMKAGYGDRIPPGVEQRKFRFTGPPREGFPPHSLFQIFVPEFWRNHYADGEFFRDKIVLVGAEGNWQHDEHQTPFGLMPGPELHLNAINAALHGEFISEPSHVQVVLVAFTAGVLAVCLSLGVRSPWLRLLVLAGGDAAIMLIALGAYNHFSIYIPMLPSLLQLNVTVLLGLASDLAMERVERKRVRRTLEKYVSTNVVQELLDRPGAFEQSLGGVVKPAAILFSDIRGYSTVTAHTDPQALVGQLNEYLSAMVECVFRHGGTLDKFIGDAVMAVWGNVRSSGLREDTANAVRAALAMHAELARLNTSWRLRGLEELRVGIAVNQGEVVVGNIGSPQRMEFTVIGDAVNVTWKLQELTKELGCELLVTGDVASLVFEEFDVESLGEAVLAGHTQATPIFSATRRGSNEAPAAEPDRKQTFAAIPAAT
jgi:adenylate cyclase